MLYVFCDCFRLAGNRNSQVIGQVFKGFLPVGPGECTETLPDPGETVYRTDDEVQSQGTDEKPEPDCVVNIEQVQEKEKLQCDRVESPRQRHGSLLLGDEGPRNRYHRKDDEEHNSQAY